MESYTFIRFINEELKQYIDDLTHNTNIFVKDIHIQKDQTIIQYEVFTMNGFETFEKTLPNIKK